MLVSPSCLFCLTARRRCCTSCRPSSMRRWSHVFKTLAQRLWKPKLVAGLQHCRWYAPHSQHCLRRVRSRRAQLLAHGDTRGPQCLLSRQHPVIAAIAWSAIGITKSPPSRLQAYAAFKFAESCMKAMWGQTVTECAYVSSQLTSLPYFASPVKLGPHGVKEILPLPSMNSAEQDGFQKMQAELNASIDKGIKFAHS
jgi:hypothetical protein